MNERQPYEQLIAEKLQQLPGPDVDASWQQMKRLLDDDQSPKGGGGRNNRPNGRWWWASLGALLIIACLWVFVESRNSSRENLSSASPKNNGNKHLTASPKDAAVNKSNSPLSAGSVKKDLVDSFNNTSTQASDKTSTPTDKTKYAPSLIKAGGAVKGNPAKENNASTAGNNSPDRATPSTAEKNIDKKSITTSREALAAKNKAGIPLAKGNKAGDNPNAMAKDNGLDEKAVKTENPFSESHPAKSKPEKSSTARNRLKKNIPATVAVTHHNKSDRNKKASTKEVLAGSKTNSSVPTVISKSGGQHKKSISSDIVNNTKNGKEKSQGSTDLLDNTISATDNAAAIKRNTKGRDKKNGGREQNLTLTKKGKRHIPAVINKDEAPFVVKIDQGKANIEGAGKNQLPGKQTAFGSQQQLLERLREGKTVFFYNGLTNDLLWGDSIQSPRDISRMLGKVAKDKIVKNQQEAADKLLAKKNKKSFHLDLSEVFKPFSLKNDGEAWWGAGLSLSTSLPIGGQSSYHYNVSGKSGLLSDYLPSPYIQFHLNDYVYLQTELNLSAPQHIPQLFVSSTTHEQNASQPYYRVQQSIYVEKLYYFNWPFSLHYSPFTNLYIEGGLQFSSLQSGLALVNEKRYNFQGADTTFSSHLLKFKDDSIAAKFSPNEWRWQTGAEYYWNQFTFGFRYNRAFKDLISASVSANLPLTTSRNASFLFFMRYNLFEGRKRDNAPVPKSLVRY